MDILYLQRVTLEFGFWKYIEFVLSFGSMVTFFQNMSVGGVSIFFHIGIFFLFYCFY